LIWGDPLYFPLIFGLTLLTAAFLAGIQKECGGHPQVKRLKTAGVAINLISLLCFKILAAYGTSILAAVAQAGIGFPSWISAYLPQIARLPLGLSFLVFQAVSLLLDAPYETANNGSLFLPASLHLLLFPKAISGPHVRFDQFRQQVSKQQFSLEQAAAGMRRFMLGFAKKALIADQLALVSNSGIFDQAPARIPPAAPGSRSCVMRCKSISTSPPTATWPSDWARRWDSSYLRTSIILTGRFPSPIFGAAGT
jgi:alginate O-acetyltransferase complex protein AlgI